MSEIERIEIDPENPPPPRVIGALSPLPPRPKATPKPRGTSTKHLTELDRFRVRTLYYDARMTTARIRQITGYSKSQIRTAIKADAAAVGRRSGRPKLPPPETRGKRSHKAKNPPVTESDVNALLIRQARGYFAQYYPTTPAEEGSGSNINDNNNDEDDEDEDVDVENDDDGDDDDLPPQGPVTPLPVTPFAIVTPSASATPIISASTSTSPMQTLAVVDSSRESSVEEASTTPGETTLKKLPKQIRIHIWRCVLLAAPSQVAPVRTWALAVLPRAPWLELGMTPPPHMKIENPPWDHYVNTRHVPATVLTQVNREARRVVLERFTPIQVSGPPGQSSKNIPTFVWIDRWSDVIHFFGEPFRLELFEMAGKCAYPKIYQ